MSDPRSPQPTNGDPQGLVPRGEVPSQRCTAHTSSGAPCKRWAIVGGKVCPTHGGSAPQVREAARRRIASLVPAAIEQLRSLAMSAESEAVQVRAIIDILDRAGLKAADEHVLVAQDAPNASLDAAIAAALGARGLLSGDQGQDDVIEAEEAPDQGILEP